MFLPLSLLSTGTSPTEIYTLSLHDALPISPVSAAARRENRGHRCSFCISGMRTVLRSEEHTSELQSRGHLVCRLLLEKKKDDLVLLFNIDRSGHSGPELCSAHW